MAYDDPRDLRDEGMHRALEKDPEWQAKALPHVIAIPKGWEGLWEEVRISCTNRGVKQPHVPQVWSAFCNACLKMELFERVNDWGQPRSRASHASAYRKLRRT
jgi:hypothetical protein